LEKCFVGAAQVASLLSNKKLSSPNAPVGDPFNLVRTILAKDAMM